VHRSRPDPPRGVNIHATLLNKRRKHGSVALEGRRVDRRCAGGVARRAGGTVAADKGKKKKIIIIIVRIKQIVKKLLRKKNFTTA
jgi:hypothetical protein